VNHSLTFIIAINNNRN